MATKYDELQEKFEQLQLDHEDTRNELVECQNDLKAARSRIQELELLLKSQTGEQRSSLVPEKIAAGNSGPGVASNSSEEELRRMFSWLADQVDFEETIKFDATEHTLVVAGEQVYFGSVVQWCLKESDLRLTVPEELASEISNVLAAAKEDPATLCNASARTIMDSWLLSINEPPSETTSAVTMLRHRQSQVSCIVANFPEPHPVLEFDGYRVGEIVEVNFEDRWFIGVVNSIRCHGEFFVQCDVDTEGVFTKAYPHSLRRPLVTFAQPESDMAATAIAELPSPLPQAQVIAAEATTTSNRTEPRSAFSHSRTRTCYW
jgi:hypothetical protein